MAIINNTATNEPLVSIVMPVYNGASTIQLALASLICQDYNNWECIIVNDGSTDDTIQMIEAMVDSRIKLINLEKNCGRGYARNVAIKNCVGKYLSYLDADDFLHHKKISKQVQMLEINPDIDLVGCGRVQFDDNLNPLLKSSSKSSQKSYHLDGKTLSLVMPSVMIRTGKASSFDYDKRLDVGEDVDYFSRYLHNSYYMNINENLYYYRLSNLSRRKLIYYAKEDIRRGFVLFERNKIAGIKVMVVQSIICIIYFLVSIWTGAGFFLNKRGHKLAEIDVIQFNNELQYIKDALSKQNNKPSPV